MIHSTDSRTDLAVGGSARHASERCLHCPAHSHLSYQNAYIEMANKITRMNFKERKIKNKELWRRVKRNQKEKQHSFQSSMRAGA